MAAYAALVSLMQIFDQIEHHPSPPIYVEKKQVEYLTEMVVFLQEFLEGYESPFADSDKADPLEMRIADAVYAVKDAIESHIVDQLLPAASILAGFTNSADLYEILRKLIKYIDSVKDKIPRQVSAGSSTYEGWFKILVGFIEAKVIEAMDLIIAIKSEVQRLVLASADFSTSADLYETVVKVIEHMDLIKKEVMEIFGFEGRLRKQVSADPSASIGGYSPYAGWCGALLVNIETKVIEDMDLIIAIKGQLQRLVSASADSSTSADLFKSAVKVIELMDLIKKDVMFIFDIKGLMLTILSPSTRSETYRGYGELLEKVKEGMDTKKEAMEIIVKDQLQRQASTSADSSTSADLYESLLKGIEEMDLNIAVRCQLQRQLQKQGSASADSSTSADLYEILVKVLEDMYLIKKEVKEIIALKDQLQGLVLASVGFATPEDLYKSRVKVTKHMDMDMTKKEVMEILVKDQRQRQVSASADLHESLQKLTEDMDLIKEDVTRIVQVKDQRQVSKSGGKMLRNYSLRSSLSRLNNTTMVGSSDIMSELVEKVTCQTPGRQVIQVVGMGGIGKTTLALNVYAHPFISDRFDICAWATISQQFNKKELLWEILSQANKEGKKELSPMSEEYEIVEALHQCLYNRRYLIVLDDMWSIEAWDKIQRYFPDHNNGSRIIVTSRLSSWGSQLDNNYCLEMKFLDQESSWNMFCNIVFRGESCPIELENTGKEIVKRCKGLPLSIVVIGGLLEKLEPTNECWESIRRSMSSLVNSENDKYCLKILKLSYNHLPVYLKPCFLYLGMFEEDRKIRVSILIKLWISEGFLKPISDKSLETIAKEYLDELVNRNLIQVHELGKTGNMKYCKIHDLLRDLCLRVAQKERFYDVVGQHSPEGTCSQRRVAILGSTPEEKVVDAMKSRPYARTWIGDCEKDQLLSNLRLLRTLKTYECSLEKLFELVNLRLLDVSKVNSTQLSSSINLLWSLQTLIIGYVDNAPVELWNMSQLRYVHVCCERLSIPPSDSIVIMENLQTLKGVKNFKFDEMMLRRIPNIKKLGLKYSDIESGDDDYGVHNIEHMQKLESLSCFCYSELNLLHKFTFPDSLMSLDLYSKQHSTEYILEKVSILPLLQKLELIGGDFTTGKWETVEDQFLSLKFLSLSCDKLEWWMMESSHFPRLEHLHLSYLKDLKEIPTELGEVPTLKSIFLRVCGESVVKSAKIMVEEQEKMQGELSFQVTVNLDRDEDNDELLKLASPNFKLVKW